MLNAYRQWPVKHPSHSGTFVAGEAGVTLWPCASAPPRRSGTSTELPTQSRRSRESCFGPDHRRPLCRRLQRRRRGRGGRIGVPGRGRLFGADGLADQAVEGATAGTFPGSAGSPRHRRVGGSLSPADAETPGEDHGEHPGGPRRRRRRPAATHSQQTGGPAEFRHAVDLRRAGESSSGSTMRPRRPRRRCPPACGRPCSHFAPSSAEWSPSSTTGRRRQPSTPTPSTSRGKHAARRATSRRRSALSPGLEAGTAGAMWSASARPSSTTVAPRRRSFSSSSPPDGPSFTSSTPWRKVLAPVIDNVAGQWALTKGYGPSTAYWHPSGPRRHSANGCPAFDGCRRSPTSPTQCRSPQLKREFCSLL